MQALPFEVSVIDDEAGIEAWLAAAPETVERMLDRWGLERGEAFVGGASAAVLAVTREDGTPAVLKVGFPHVEAVWEAVGLQAFPAGSAPALLEQDAWTWSMLLERVSPGTPLSLSAVEPEDALRLGGALHARLTAAPVPDEMPRLEERLRDYVASARSRLEAGQDAELDSLAAAFPDAAAGDVGDAVELVRAGLAEAIALASSPAPAALLHGDFNPGNILSGTAGPVDPDDPAAWRVIDPKPVVGDPAFDLWPLVSQTGSPFDSPDAASRLRRAITIASSAAGCDPVRVTRWSFARSALSTTWFLSESNPTAAAAELGALRLWSSLCE